MDMLRTVPRAEIGMCHTAKKETEEREGASRYPGSTERSRRGPLDSPKGSLKRDPTARLLLLQKRLRLLHVLSKPRVYGSAKL